LQTVKWRSAQGVLTVWHNVDHGDVAQHSPLLAGKVAAQTSRGIARVAVEIAEVLSEAAENPPRPNRSGSPTNDRSRALSRFEPFAVERVK
jgi:hypothetical protein